MEKESLKGYDRIIMGIDPGTNIMGYGLLGVKKKKAELILSGVITLGKFDTHYKKLRRIFERITSLIIQYLPDEMALEAPFFGKNVQSMLKLGRAQGVAMAAALVRDIPIAEYAPLTVKQSVTGNGQASKEQVANMVSRILKIDSEDIPEYLDSTDALAVALTHFYETSKPEVLSTQSSKSKKLNPWGHRQSTKSWESFLMAHPDKIKSGFVKKKTT